LFGSETLVENTNLRIFLTECRLKRTKLRIASETLPKDGTNADTDKKGRKK
jgi:hypothetical protein